MYSGPAPLVSPDGRHVAYVNRGYVCVAEIETNKTRRLAEVPDSWTHVLASLQEFSGGGGELLMHDLGPDRYKEFQGRVTKHIGMFQWTADSSAVIYSVYWNNAAKQATEVHVWRAPLVGEAKEIASNEHAATSRRGPGDMLTRDGRFLVGNFGGRDRALVWDLSTNKPRATPFLYLTPSPTSGHWLGVEKDTRQLVALDEDFKITQRYEEILPKEDYGFDMIWSPDERFVFWRQQVGFDHYSNWAGCRLDLETRDRQIFTGDYMGEKIIFPGKRGEFIRIGAAGIQGMMSGLMLTDEYVGIVADGSFFMHQFWSRHADPPGTASKIRMIGRMATVTWSPDFELFTIGLPREAGPYGEVMHLVDRKRHAWKLPGDDTGQYIAPYKVAGFALGGKAIVAYDDSRLFALPVEAIQTPENEISKRPVQPKRPPKGAKPNQAAGTSGLGGTPVDGKTTVRAK
jgi:hypothetical protein